MEEQSIDIFTAKNCAEAALALWSDCPPHLVFTEIQLADGNWADVLTLAAKASAPVNVIVVAPFVDISFYLQAIERGAFDFIVPPLSDPELLHVVRIAAENALSRRRSTPQGCRQPPISPPLSLGTTSLIARCRRFASFSRCAFALRSGFKELLMPLRDHWRCEGTARAEGVLGRTLLTALLVLLSLFLPTISSWRWSADDSRRGRGRHCGPASGDVETCPRAPAGRLSRHPVFARLYGLRHPIRLLD